MVHIISAGTALGSFNQGTEMAPEVILQTGLMDELQRLGWATRVSEVESKSTQYKGFFVGGLRNADTLLPWLKALYAQARATGPDEIQLVLGGDHSIGAPSLLATKRHYPDAVCVYVDAHPDAHSVESTETGNIHGLPVRIAAGETLREHFAGPYFRADEICMVAIKDVDRAEWVWLREQGIRYFGMDAILEQGIGKVMREVAEWAQGRPVHVSYDIDAIDVQYAPGTGIQNFGGLTYREAEYIARKLGGLRPVGVDMVEVNPSRDQDGRTIELAIELIVKLLGEDWSHYRRYLEVGSSQ